MKRFLQHKLWPTGSKIALEWFLIIWTTISNSHLVTVNQKIHHKINTHLAKSPSSTWFQLTSMIHRWSVSCGTVSRSACPGEHQLPSPLDAPVFAFSLSWLVWGVACVLMQLDVSNIFYFPSSNQRLVGWLLFETTNQFWFILVDLSMSHSWGTP